MKHACGEQDIEAFSQRGERVPVDEVNRLVKGFKRVKQLFKNMPDMKAQAKKMGGMPDLDELQNQLKGKKWH
jgi:signal recognition particle GTPase